VRAFAAGGLFRWPDGREGCFAFPHIHTKNFAGRDRRRVKKCEETNRKKLHLSVCWKDLFCRLHCWWIYLQQKFLQKYKKGIDRGIRKVVL